MTFVCGEASWMKCLDGKKLPLEIALASVEDPDIVCIVKVILPEDLQMTLKDMANTRSYIGNKDRFENRLRLKPFRMLPPTRIFKVKMNDWFPALRDIASYMFGNDVVLGVRCPSQMDFFENACGFDARYVKNTTSGELWGCHHKHGKIVPYLCPATEARTMAVHLRKEQLGYH